MYSLVKQSFLIFNVTWRNMHKNDNHMVLTVEDTNEKLERHYR